MRFTPFCHKHSPKRVRISGPTPHVSTNSAHSVDRFSGLSRILAMRGFIGRARGRYLAQFSANAPAFGVLPQALPVAKIAGWLPVRVFVRGARAALTRAGSAQEWADPLPSARDRITTAQFLDGYRVLA